MDLSYLFIFAAQFNSGEAPLFSLHPWFTFHILSCLHSICTKDCFMVETRSASRVVNHDSSVVDSKLVARAAMTSGGYSDEEDSDPGRSDITSSRIKRAIKRPRNSANCPQTSKRPRRRGRLELMPTMNLDVLFHVRQTRTTFYTKLIIASIQIFSFLLPMDLLNLSRTNKDFRNLLLRRSSAAAWKAARLHVDGLPDCPPDIAEPQYANLVFYSHCHVRQAFTEMPPLSLTGMS